MEVVEESDCNWDKEAATKYLGETFYFKVLYNQETFK